MVVCKYFQQGSCRFGQFCRFQHINNYAPNQGNTNKPFTETKNIVLGVAEEVLAAERGGQWLLSCFGPFKEQPCIPGMEDVSPEEVRWEIYQAQKNGTVDQTKLQFQQVCQAMSVKRDALKNPTQETAAMLDKLQKGNRDSTFGGKTNFALSTPQMSQSSNITTNSSVFGARSTASNPFGGGFNAAPATTSSMFGRTNTTSSSVFGAKSSFGGNAMFGNQGNDFLLGGGGAKPIGGAVFGGNQNMQTFATAGSANNSSVFGGNAFGSTSQAANGPFSMSQAAQSTTSVFGTTATATNSVFGGSSSTLFGSPKPAANPFGAATTMQPANSIFGGSAVMPATSTIGTSIFAKPANTAEFGGAAVFRPPTGQFPGAPGQAGFDNSQTPSTNVFGGTSTQASTFGSYAQTTNSFGALAAPSATPFGAVVSAENAAPFGTQSGPFGAAAGSPFARATPFGNAMQPGNESVSGFGPAATSSADSAFSSGGNSGGAFGNLAPPASQPFGASAFGNSPSTPFASTTSTTTTSNPFAPRSQQQVNTPFGVAQTTMSSSGPFGQSSFGSITTASIIDETAYTIEGKLTDDEKSSYLADQFILGKIPLKPPTIELR